MKRPRTAAGPAILLSLAFSVLAVEAADKAKAEKALKEALGAENAAGVQAACDELIEAGGKDAMGAILGLAPKVEGAFYWQLVGAASGFRDQPALDELGKFVVAHQSDAKSSLSRDLVFGLQNNKSERVIAPLSFVLEKGGYDLKLMAVDQLALLRSLESIDALIASYKREEKGDAELKARLENSLRLLTGESFGDAANWEGWWKVQRAKGIPEAKASPAGAGAGSGTMEKPRDNEFQGTVEKLTKERVIVLTGCYDEVEQILEGRKIPHTAVKKTDFDADPKKYLAEAYAVLVNCDDCYEGKPPGVPDSHGKRLSQGTLDALKSWVENQGGFLFTEDWGLIDVTAVLWPDKVSTMNGAAIPPMIDEITVKLTPARGNTSHPLMRGVWQKPRKIEAPAAPGEEKTKEKVESPAQPLQHKWKVDNLSAGIKIVDTVNVVPLFESDELAKAPNATQYVAVTFRVGKWEPKHPAGTATGGGGGSSKTTGEFAAHAKGGRVLHTLSHFGHQSSEDDGQALQNLLTNFLLEAAKHHEGVAPAKK
jgi:hypothetical protein